MINNDQNTAIDMVVQNNELMRKFLTRLEVEVKDMGIIFMRAGDMVKGKDILEHHTVLVDDYEFEFIKTQEFWWVKMTILQSAGQGASAIDDSWDPYFEQRVWNDNPQIIFQGNVRIGYYVTPDVQFYDVWGCDRQVKESLGETVFYCKLEPLVELVNEGYEWAESQLTHIFDKRYGKRDGRRERILQAIDNNNFFMGSNCEEGIKSMRSYLNDLLVEHRFPVSQVELNYVYSLLVQNDVDGAIGFLKRK